MLLGSVQVTYLGNEQIQISESEELNCYFYVFTQVNEGNPTEEIALEVENRDYFILETQMRKHESMILPPWEDQLSLITFEEPLRINGRKMVKFKGVRLPHELKEDFLYALGVDHMNHEDLESCERVMAQTGDLYLYTLVCQCKSLKEKEEMMEELTLCVKDRSRRFTKGRLSVQVPPIETEPMSLLEVLEAVVADEGSRLLWDYSQEYERIGMKRECVEDRYQFVKPRIGYGEVSEVCIGSKKMNISVRVKVEGAVEDTQTELKLDAFILREYNLVVDGNVHTPWIWCKLSPALKRRFSKQKIVKTTLQVLGEEIVKLDLRRLKVTSKRILRSLTRVEIAKGLYELEVLRCKQGVLRSLVKEYPIKGYPLIEGMSEEMRMIRKRYRVEAQRMYRPVGVEQGKVMCDYQIYKARIMEWKIEKFPKKKYQEEIREVYQSWIEADEKQGIESIQEELRRLKNERKKLELRINRVRLASGLAEREAFLWETKEYREKCERDKQLKGNCIIGGRVCICTQCVEGIHLRQDCYSMLVSCQECL